MHILKKRNALSIGAVAISLIVGCSSTPPMKTQAYAKLSHERTYEYEFPVVWKALEETLRNYRITHRNPNEVDPLEMRKLTRRTLETDWVYAQSRDKYEEYKINGSPRKIYLQTRFKYFVDSQKVLGGVTVNVDLKEEVEKLNTDGTSAGYESVRDPDSSRTNELLDKIKNSILAAPNTSQPGS